MEKKVSKAKKVVKAEPVVVQTVTENTVVNLKYLSDDEVRGLNNVDNQGEIAFAKAIQTAFIQKNNL